MLYLKPCIYRRRTLNNIFSYIIGAYEWFGPSRSRIDHYANVADLLDMITFHVQPFQPLFLCQILMDLIHTGLDTSLLSHMIRKTHCYEDVRSWKTLKNFQNKDIFTLAISKCYGKVRALFFPGDNFLVSRVKLHSSRVRSLVVRCLLFNPEVSFSNPCICANFLQVI